VEGWMEGWGFKPLKFILLNSPWKDGRNGRRNLIKVFILGVIK